jgi:hypothetical protein
MNKAQRWTMVAVVVGSGIVFLDTSVVNLALPRMAEELPSGLFAPLEAQSYVAGGYFVTLSALLVLAGPSPTATGAGACSPSAWPGSRPPRCCAVWPRPWSC